MNRLRIIHIGTGYPPIAGGGLTRYALDLMSAQAEAGHEVFYLCAGDFDLGFRARIRRWRMGAVQILELRNPRVENVQLGSQAHPGRELADLATERLIMEAITAGIRHSAFGFRDNNGVPSRQPTADSQESLVRFLCRSESRKPKAESPLPDVVHLHNLMGWPISLLGLLAERGIPVVYTVQNYHAVCPTTRLYDEVADEVCEDFAEGRRCARCNAAKPPARQFRFLRRFRLDRLLRIMPGLFNALRGIKRLVLRKREGPAFGFRHSAFGTTTASSDGPAPLPAACAVSETFRKRREMFVSALNGKQLPVLSSQLPVSQSPKPKAQSRPTGVTVIAMSHRVAELLVKCGVEASRIRVLSLVLGDFDKIVRRPPRTPALPIRFGLLNKLTHLKGADVLREAFAGLSRDQVRLLVFGSQSEAGVAAIRPLLDAGIAELRGPYERLRMNDVLAEVDVGLVPSIWEEPYGYVGVEFLAAGIPVLGSRIGGIPDYVEDGVNGFLLPPTDPGAWRAKITELAGAPAEVERLARGIKPVKTMREHLEEIEALYRDSCRKEAQETQGAFE